MVRDVGVLREALSAAEKARDDKAAINPEMRSFSVIGWIKVFERAAYKKNKPSATTRLRPALSWPHKRGVGPPERGVQLSFWVYHDRTDAYRHGDVVDQRAGDAAAQSFGYSVRRVEVGFRHHDGEFFATQPRHQIRV